MYYGTYQPVTPPTQHGYVLTGQMIPSGAYQPAPVPRPYEHISIKLPTQEYKQPKILLVPFDPRLCNDGKFDSLREALEFIAKHCNANHGYFTKQIAKKYLDMCRILDGPTGKYTAMKVLEKDFKPAFHQVKQSLEGENSQKRP